MKWLVIVLVAVNILIFLLSQQEREVPVKVTLPEELSKGSLRLLSELEEQKPDREDANPSTQVAAVVSEGHDKAEADNDSVEPEPQNVSGVSEMSGESDEKQVVDTSTAGAGDLPQEMPVEVCGSLGPIGAGDDARQLISQLEKAGVEGELNNQTRRVPYMYRVFSPPAPNRQMARDMLSRMQKAGLSDLQRIPQGELKNAISLGAFSTLENAEKRRQEVEEKDFPAVIEVDYEAVSEYWVDFRYSDPKSAETIDRLLEEDPALTKKSHVCPYIVSG